jgi:uncharacterized Zn finger protein
METNLEKLRCGSCGESKHEIYLRENGELIAECIKCNNKSVITISEPKILIKNFEGNGCLTNF